MIQIHRDDRLWSDRRHLGVYVSVVTHFCQQVACMTWPQLPVWVPTARSGGMNRGYVSGAQRKEHDISSNRYQAKTQDVDRKSVV